MTRTKLQHCVYGPLPVHTVKVLATLVVPSQLLLPSDYHANSCTCLRKVQCYHFQRKKGPNCLCFLQSDLNLQLHYLYPALYFVQICCNFCLTSSAIFYQHLPTFDQLHLFSSTFHNFFIIFTNNRPDLSNFFAILYPLS